MYSVTGEIINLFETKKTDKYDASYRVQLLGENVLKNGQVRKDMITLSVPEKLFLDLRSKEGQNISLPVGIFVQHGKLVPFYTGPDQVPA